MEMAEKLTVKALSGELETLRKRLREYEAGFERKLESAMEKATEKLKARIQASQGPAIRVQGHGGAVDVDARRRLIAECAYLSAERRGFTCGSPEQEAVLSRTGWKQKWKLTSCCYRDGQRTNPGK
jgi:hypothetical protein